MPASHKRKILQGSASNLIRMLLSMLVSLTLPPFLVHRMSPAEYGAWVLILQLSTYVNFLDFGLQTAIGKFVAEYDATGEREAARRVVSTAFTILAGAAAIGAGVIGVLTWRVPRLFHQMPASLMHDARWGLAMVGLSLTLALPFNAFLAIFNGLQRYAFPTVLSAGSRILSAAGLVLILLRHGTLLEMALLLATFNAATAVLEVIGWRRYLSARVRFSFFFFDRETALELAKYCGTLSIWTISALCISGLDTALVAHYDYANTGFYGVASGATNFMLALVSSILGPLFPALSSIQANSTPARMGEILVRATRYGALLLCVLGLPLIIAGYPLLRFWVGGYYAARSVLFLQVLVVGNMIRQLGFPYVMVVVATGRQHLATVAPIAEGLVNLLASVLLARRYGAIGIALGTPIGAVVGLCTHFAMSLRLTQPTVRVRRSRLLAEGILLPLSSLLPSLLLLPLWRSTAMLPLPPAWLALWALASLAMMLFVGLRAEERLQLRGALARLV